MYKTTLTNILTDIKHKLTTIDISNDNIEELLTTYKDNKDITLTLISDLIDKYKPNKFITDYDKQLLHDYIVSYIRYTIKIKILTNMSNGYICKDTTIKENLSSIDNLIDKVINNHTDNSFTTITNIDYLITKLRYTDNNLYLTIKLLLHNKLYN